MTKKERKSAKPKETERDIETNAPTLAEPTAPETKWTLGEPTPEAPPTAPANPPNQLGGRLDATRQNGHFARLSKKAAARRRYGEWLKISPALTDALLDCATDDPEMRAAFAYSTAALGFTPLYRLQPGSHQFQIAGDRRCAGYTAASNGICHIRADPTAPRADMGPAPAEEKARWEMMGYISNRGRMDGIQMALFAAAHETYHMGAWIAARMNGRDGTPLFPDRATEEHAADAYALGRLAAWDGEPSDYAAPSLFPNLPAAPTA